MLTVIVWMFISIAVIGKSDEGKLAFGYKLVVFYLPI